MVRCVIVMCVTTCYSMRVEVRIISGVIPHLLPCLRQIPCPSLLCKPGWPVNFWGFFPSLPLSSCRILGLRDMPTTAPGWLSHRLWDPSSGRQASHKHFTYSPMASVTTTFFEIIALQPLTYKVLSRRQPSLKT